MLLNFRDRTRPGVSNMLWPLGSKGMSRGAEWGVERSYIKLNENKVGGGGGGETKKTGVFKSYR